MTFSLCARRRGRGWNLVGLAALALTGCAEPDMLSQPPGAPKMAAGVTATPLPAYAERLGETAAVARTGAIPLPSETAPLAAQPPDAAASGGWAAVLAMPDGTRPGWIRQTESGFVAADGSSLSILDDLYFHSDGRWTRRSGDSFQHSDGSATVKSGDSYFHSDGSWSRRSGNAVTRSDGKVCAISGPVLSCP